MGYDRGQLLNRIIQQGYWDDFLSFATYMWWEKRYSIFNSALIYLQRPGALYVETEAGWKTRFSRWIRPDATPIVVLHPFGPVNFLYEYSDTYGEGFPSFVSMRNQFEQPGRQPLTREMLPRAREMVSHLGIWYGEAKLGSRLCGKAELLEHPLSYIHGKGKSAVTVKTKHAITVNSSLEDQARVLTVFHEIGHILCGHFPPDKDNIILKTPRRENIETMPESQKEYEAEKVCELFSAIQGLEYDPAAYLKQYSGNCMEECSLRYVVDAVDKMLTAW